MSHTPPPHNGVILNNEHKDAVLPGKCVVWGYNNVHSALGWTSAGRMCTHSCCPQPSDASVVLAVSPVGEVEVTQMTRWSMGGGVYCSLGALLKTPRRDTHIAGHRAGWEAQETPNGFGTSIPRRTGEMDIWRTTEEGELRSLCSADKVTLQHSSWSGWLPRADCNLDSIKICFGTRPLQEYQES